jgi:DNA-binding XRE family transcriptional regulator
MAKRKIRHVRNAGRVTDEQAARYDEIRRKIREEFPPKARSRRDPPIPLQDIMAALKAARTQKGLTLAEITESTGIATPNLSTLENSADANPTVQTLLRYADALGKTIHVVLDDARN